MKSRSNGLREGSIDSKTMHPVRMSEGLEIENLSESGKHHSVLIEGNFINHPPISNGTLAEKSQTAQRYSDNQGKEDSTLSILQGEPSVDQDRM
jgi:hypothetical protein